MIVFVDYNDVCRAPLAAAIYSELFGKPAESAGVYADEGAAVCEALCPEQLIGHKARRLTDDILQEAESIWCVTAAIARHLAEAQPGYAAKIRALEDVPDPNGMGRDAYLACADEIRTKLEGLR